MTRKYILLGFLAVCLLVFFMNGIFMTHVSREHHTYEWDEVTYWRKYVTSLEVLSRNDVPGLFRIYQASLAEDYNNTPLLPLLPFHTILSPTRQGYISALINAYAIPSALLLALLICRLGQATGLTKRTSELLLLFICSLFLILFFPFWWGPVLIGLPDIGGVAIISLVLFCYLTRSLDRLRLRELTVISFCLFMLIVYRRWYAYWTVSFFTAVAIMDVVPALLRKYGRYEIVSKYVLLLVFTAGFFILLGKDSFLQLTRDYGTMFSAFRYSRTPASYILEIVRFYGWYGICLFLGSSVVLLRNKPTRRPAALLLCIGILITVLISQTQNMHAQQFYLHFPTYLTIIALGLFTGYARIRSFRWRIGVLTVHTVIWSFLFLAFLFPEYHRPAMTLGPLVSQYSHLPKIRPDYTSFLMLITHLQSIVSENDNVYVLSSSDTLNFSIVQNACLYLQCERDLSGNILWTHDVDKRDGFPKHIVAATYIITSDPPQTHLAPQDQALITVLRNSLLEGINVGKHFEPVPTNLTVDGTIAILIYKRISPITRESLDELSSLLREFYPDTPSVYRTY